MSNTVSFIPVLIRGSLFLHLAVRFRGSDEFIEKMEYFRKCYGRGNCVTLPAPDHSDRENVDGRFVLDFPFKREEVDKLSDMYGLGRNGFYIAAAAFFLAFDCDNGNVAFEWTWNGRPDIRRMDSVGCFIKDMPVTFETPSDKIGCGYFIIPQIIYGQYQYFDCKRVQNILRYYCVILFIW